MSKLADSAFAVWDFLFGDDQACWWTRIGGVALFLLAPAFPWSVSRWFALLGFALAVVATLVAHFRRDQQVLFARKRRLSFQVPPVREPPQSGDLNTQNPASVGGKSESQ
jgi:hypothetical protein